MLRIIPYIYYYKDISLNVNTFLRIFPYFFSLYSCVNQSVHSCTFGIRDQQGRDQQGRDQQGRDQQGRDQQGMDQQGMDQQGRDQQGRDQQTIINVILSSCVYLCVIDMVL